MSRRFTERDLVVYQKSKHGTHPGPRARQIRAAPLGETYDYVVDKYWIVREARGGSLELRTPGGKRHEVDRSDPNLRRPTLRERLWLYLGDRQRLRALRRWLT